mmetsp:Transcript_28094/g.62896  ORF Transcript_28094/g.62896 Transcript_28094/m.62896 type:complete len:464 (+) Transcript_28094:271-1662(+)
MGEVDDIAKILESCVPCPDGSGANFTMIDSGTEIGQEILGYALCDLAREDSGRSQQMKEGEYVTTANGGQRKKPTECANCGVEQDDDVEIRACSKCKADGYCSKKCQLAHWPKHKKSCKLLAGIDKALTSCKDEAEAMGNLMRLMSKQNQPMTGLYATHAGMISSDDTVMPPGVPENFLWLKSALTEFGRLKGDKREYGEKAYKKLYGDLVANKQVWMHFFQRNQTHTGDTCLILEQLAHIYSARGKWDDCAGVLEYWEALIDIVRKLNLSHSKQYDLSCMADHSEHRCKLIQHEMHEALGRPDLNAPVLRQLIRLERSPNLQGIPESIQNKTNWDRFAEMYQTTASIKLPSTSIERLSDEDVAKVLVKTAEVSKSVKSAFPQFFQGIDASKTKQDAKMSLLSCAYCGKDESYLGELKKCTRCKEAVYCNRECQLAGWPSHKKDCNKSKKPKKPKKPKKSKNK